jgi:MFS transporter, DHA1 family, multidrug resistance protein
MGEFIAGEAKQIAVPSYPVLLFTCCAVAGACYFGSFMRVPVVPLYARSFGADAFEVGIINAAFLLMAGIVSLPLGILSDRLGRKLLILTGLALAAGSSFLLSFSTSTVQLVAIHLLLGVSLGMFGPTMMSYVADITPATHLGRAYGWYALALNSGMSVGPATGGLMAEWLGFRSVFVLSGAVILLVFWMTLFLLPRARHVLLHRHASRDTKALMKDLSKNVPLLSCWLVTLGSCFAMGMYTTFVPLFAVEQGMNTGEIGLIFATQALFNALSRVPFGRLTDTVARRSDLVVVGLLGVTGTVASFGIASSMFEFILCAAGLGISIGIAYTAIGALIPEVVKADSRGLAMGGYNSCIYLGMMLSSLGMGALVGDLGYRNCFFIVALTNLLTTGIFYLGMRNSGVVRTA